MIVRADRRSPAISSTTMSGESAQRNELLAACTKHFQQIHTRRKKAEKGK